MSSPTNLLPRADNGGSASPSIDLIARGARKSTRIAWLAAATLFFAAPAVAQIKIAFVEPLSGPFANIGENGLAHFKTVADRINAAGGVLGQKIEIVKFDNKGSPQETLATSLRVPPRRCSRRSAPTSRSSATTCTRSAR